MFRRKKLKGLYRAVFGSHAGEEVLGDIYKKSGLMQSSFAGTPQEIAFNEGKRYIGLYIAGLMNDDYEKVTQAIIKNLETNSYE